MVWNTVAVLQTIQCCVGDNVFSGSPCLETMSCWGQTQTVDLCKDHPRCNLHHQPPCSWLRNLSYFFPQTKMPSTWYFPHRLILREIFCILSVLESQLWKHKLLACSWTRSIWGHNECAGKILDVWWETWFLKSLKTSLHCVSCWCIFPCILEKGLAVAFPSSTQCPTHRVLIAWLRAIHLVCVWVIVAHSSWNLLHL